MRVPQQIADRLQDYLDGSLDDAGQEILTEWLHASDAHREAVAEWFLSEAELLEASRLADMRDVFEGLAFDTRGEKALRVSQPPAQKSRLAPGSQLAIAASVAAAFIAGYIWLKQAKNKDRVVAVASSDVRHANILPPSPALLGRLSECVWEQDMKPIRVGEDIAAGTMIDIKSGLAQIVFESGAEVVLKGPCRLRVDSSMLCRLFSGAVSAEVPHRAAGFTIRGPSAEVIDLGTRFGFSVGASGDSEVHVFQGEVISRQLNDRGDVVGEEIRLRKNQAILFPGEKREAQRLAANEAKFALEVKPLWRHDKIEPLAVERNLALWLRASHGVQRDRKNKVIAWQDLALGPNRVTNDAFQPNPKARPQYISNAINGRPAIRFDGLATYMTATPITTSNDQTIVAVFQYARPAADVGRIGGQIINYNGPPSRYLPDVHSPGVLQLGEKIDKWNGPALSIAAKAFVGRDTSGNDVSAGVVVSESLGALHPRAVVYVYNNSQNRAALYVDASIVAESSAPTRVAVTSRKVIGKHGIFDQWYFHGDLAELLIFNTALRPAELNAINRQLMDYYRIDTDIEARL